MTYEPPTVTPIGNLRDKLAEVLPCGPDHGNVPSMGDEVNARTLSGPGFAPTVGRTVLYFPDDERNEIQRRTGRVWPAIITKVYDRAYGAEGEEIGPWVVSLTAFPPSTDWPDSPVIAFDYVPLSGMYDREDLDAHPAWVGCWNWPPAVP